MKAAITVLLLLVGVIHLLPVSGVLGAERLAALYGISVAEPNLEVLMRHRAVLFALLGAYLVYAAFTPSAQVVAIVAGFVSVVSFLWLAQAAPAVNELLTRVVIADAVALACLVVAAVLLVRVRLLA
ncbi:MAG: phosphopantetheine adenylyltransferase [Pseudomonadota bacterium]